MTAAMFAAASSDIACVKDSIDPVAARPQGSSHARDCSRKYVAQRSVLLLRESRASMRAAPRPSGPDVVFAAEMPAEPVLDGADARQELRRTLIAQIRRAMVPPQRRHYLQRVYTRWQTYDLNNRLSPSGWCHDRHIVRVIMRPPLRPLRSTQRMSWAGTFPTSPAARRAAGTRALPHWRSRPHTTAAAAPTCAGLPDPRGPSSR